MCEPLKCGHPYNQANFAGPWVVGLEGVHCIAFLPPSSLLRFMVLPKITGTRPPPCSGFSLTMIDKQHAVMYGGLIPGGRVTSDVYILDLARMVS